MHVYLIAYWLSALVAYVARKRRASMMLAGLFGLFLILFIGLRGDVGCDTLTYQRRFLQMYQGVGWLDQLRESEGLFAWFNMVFSHNGYGFGAFLLGCAAIFVFALWRLASVYPRPFSVMVLAFPVLVIQLAMSGLRQALATAFLMLALHAFVRGRKAVTALLILLAWQFHASAIAFLPIALLAGRDFSIKRVIVAVLLMSPFVAWMLSSRLEVYHDRYVEQIYGENSSSGAWFRYVLIVVPFLLFEWRRRLVRVHFPALYDLLCLFAVIAFAVALVGAVSSVALHRLVFYVMPVSILALLCVTDCMFARSSRRVAHLVPFFLYGGYITAWFLFSKHSSACYVPYGTWLT